jgi:phytanoyl-CoA hydroxylase
MLPISTTRADFYRQNGYWIERGFVSSEVIHNLLQQLKIAFSQQLHRFDNSCSPTWPLRKLMNGLFKASLPTYHATAKLVQYLPSLVSLTVSPHALSLCHELGLAMPVVALRQVFHFLDLGLELPGGYSLTPAHQDWRSLQGSLDSLVFWIMLYDEGQNFPLEVVPGSHNVYLPTTEDVFGHRIADTHLPTADQFIQLDFEPGDLLIFSTFLIHRTGDRGNNGFRVATSFRFNNFMEPTFIERGYPHPYLTKPDFKELTPGFPQEKDLRKVFAT